MEKREYTQDDLESIQYFYKEKENIERFSCWEEIKESVYRDFPQLEKAINDFKASKKILDLVVEDLVL